MDYIEKITIVVMIILCHLIGDYVLQSDFIATTKGKNWYHMFVHCALYCVPFYLCFGINIQLLILFITHIIIDPLKARYNIIDYTMDQILHYVVIFILYVLI